MDQTVFYHGLIAFFIPFGWAVILYPFYIRNRENWEKLLIAVVVLSFLVMVVKELFDPEISVNDIVADILGLFFGTSIVSSAFHLGSKLPSKQNKHLKQKILKEYNEIKQYVKKMGNVNQRQISLRNVVAIGIKIQEKGVTLYEVITKKTSDPKKRELFSMLAKEKREDAKKLNILLSRWSPKVPDPDFLEWMDKEIDHQEIFISNTLIDSSEQEILEYAIKQEDNISSLFSSFKKNFPKYSWKMTQLESLILAVKENRDKLDQRLAQLNESPHTESVVTLERSSEKYANDGEIIMFGDEKHIYEVKILIADDEKGIRDSLKEYLNEDGFIDIDTASNGKEAIEYFKRKRYDIVIVDIFMPKRYGIDVLKYVKSHSPNSQVIIITARGAKKTVLEAFESGVFDYIEKPFKFDTLSNIVKRAVQEKLFLDKE